jgi:hypothetical protein
MFLKLTIVNVSWTIATLTTGCWKFLFARFVLEAFICPIITHLMKVEILLADQNIVVYGNYVTPLILI